jgi:hypothetical protein
MPRKPAAEAAAVLLTSMSLQSLNDYKFIFLHFCDHSFELFWGVYYTFGKAFSRPFQWYMTRPQITTISVVKPK